ncbi:hypothetical protein EB093_01890, partial [bacterium]|nr:hypothetical protein [bacterium]
MTENWGAYSDYFKSEFFKNFGATAARVKISAEVHSLFEPSTSYKCIIEADRILISSIGKHRFSARFSVRENIGFFNDKP